MLTNYIKTAWRNILKHKTNSMLNMLGLALGLCCCLLISAFVRSELSYDKGFAGSDRVYRITDEAFGDNGKHWAATAPALAMAIKNYMPGIEETARLSYVNSRVLAAGSSGDTDKKFEEKGGYYVDNNILTMFGFQLLRGHRASALQEINTIVLTETMAKKYFADEDALGQTIRIIDGNEEHILTVSGVVRDIPFNTHLNFDYLVSMPTLAARLGDRMSSVSWNAFYTYVKLGKGQPVSSLEAKMPQFLLSFYTSPDLTREQILESGTFRFQPVSSIHLHSKLEKEMNPNSDIKYVYIFSCAGLLILFIACINFINISTVQALKRLREVGVRKAIGARRGELIRQFLSETMLQTIMSVLFAILLFWLAIPYYEMLSGKELEFGQLFSLFYILFLAGVLLLVGLLSGLYPAYFASGFEAVNALKGKSSSASVGILRRSLITLQFTVSVFLIASTIIINQQMNLFRNSDLGFNKEQIIAVKLLGDLKNKIASNPGIVKTQFSGNTAITGSALVSRLPGERLGTEQVYLLDKSRNINSASMRCLWADENYLNTLGVKVEEGRNFAPNTNDTLAAYILNEAGVKALGLDNPVGQNISFQDRKGLIVGVVKDYNFASLHSAVEPLIITYDPSSAGYLLLKTSGAEVQNIISFVRSKTKVISSFSLFNYSFLDENLEALYASEKRVESIFSIFSGFAIFISCLGLFGLSTYTARLRIKEIGIRKVLGASESSIVSLLSSDFLLLVVIALVIATPVSWWLMQKWLEDFVYRIEIQWWVFLLTGCIAIFIAFVTVSVQAFKAAIANPVKSLRSE